MPLTSSFPIIVLAAFCFVSCHLFKRSETASQPAQASPSPVAESVPESVVPPRPAVTYSPRCLALIADKVCTDEESPTTCVFQGETAKGANPCKTTNQLRLQLCEKELSFDEEQFKCFEATKTELTDWQEHKTSAQINCQFNDPCPKDSHPSKCRFADLSFEASNKCLAVRGLKELACKTGVIPDLKDIKCAPQKSVP